KERLSNGTVNASIFSYFRHRAFFTTTQSKRIFELGLTGGPLKPSFGLSGVPGVSWPGALGTEAISAIRPEPLRNLQLLPASCVVHGGIKQANVRARAGAAPMRVGLCVYGYVVMPEHVHLLLSEPQHGTLAGPLKSLK